MIDEAESVNLASFKTIAKDTLHISEKEKTQTFVYQLMLGLGAVPGAITGTVDFVVNHFFIYQLFNITSTMLTPIVVSMSSLIGLGMVGTGIGIYNAHSCLDEERKTIDEIERSTFIILNRAADAVGMINIDQDVSIEKRIVAIHQFITTNTMPDLSNTGLTPASLEMLAPFRNYFDESTAPQSMHLLFELIQQFARFRAQPEHEHLLTLWEDWKKCGYQHDEQMCEAFTQCKTTKEITHLLQHSLHEKIVKLKKQIHHLSHTLTEYLKKELPIAEKNELDIIHDNFHHILVFLNEISKSDFIQLDQLAHAMSRIENYLVNLPERNLSPENMQFNHKISEIRYQLELTIKTDIQHLHTWLENKNKFSSLPNLDKHIYFGKNTHFQNFLINKSGVLFKHKGTPEGKLNLLWRAIGIGVGLFAAGQLMYGGIMALCAAVTVSTLGANLILSGFAVLLTAIAMKCYYLVKRRSDNRKIIKDKMQKIMENYALVQKVNSPQRDVVREQKEEKINSVVPLSRVRGNVFELFPARRDEEKIVESKVDRQSATPR